MPPVQGVDTSQRLPASAAKKPSPTPCRTKSPMPEMGTAAPMAPLPPRGVNGIGPNRPSRVSGVGAQKNPKGSGIPVLVGAAKKLRAELSALKIPKVRGKSFFPLPKLEDMTAAEPVLPLQMDPIGKISGRKRKNRVPRHFQSPAEPTFQEESAVTTALSNPCPHQPARTLQSLPEQDDHTELDSLCERILTVMHRLNGVKPISTWHSIPPSLSMLGTLLNPAVVPELEPEPQPEELLGVSEEKPGDQLSHCRQIQVSLTVASRSQSLPDIASEVLPSAPPLLRGSSSDDLGATPVKAGTPLATPIFTDGPNVPVGQQKVCEQVQCGGLFGPRNDIPLDAMNASFAPAPRGDFVIDFGGTVHVDGGSTAPRVPSGTPPDGVPAGCVPTASASKVDVACGPDPPDREKPTKCDNELRSRPKAEAAIECGKTRGEWEDLVAEFDRFIYMKTQSMKRDASFVQSLTGLMQRWLKKKEIDDHPNWFVDRLMDIATNRLKPSDIEVNLAKKLADPDTRFGLKTVNNALRGEVFSVDRQTVMEWGVQWASEIRLSNWIPTWKTEKRVVLPLLPLWTMFIMWAWFILFDPTCWYFVGQHWEPDTMTVHIPWWGAYYSVSPGPQWKAVEFTLRGLINLSLRIGWWYSVVMWLRRVVGCCLYMCKDYTRDGYMKTLHNGWSVFRPGNV